MPEALEALVSDAEVWVDEVTVTGWGSEAGTYWVFEPMHTTPTTGFIIYPGASIDPRSYAPTARGIALQGFRTFIVSMPRDFALMGVERARDVQIMNPAIDMWAIGGHSVGGVAACSYAKSLTEAVDGVVLWASYPSPIYRLDQTDLDVMSIFGTNDGLTTPQHIEDSESDLPADTIWIEILGGNHTNFGWYGDGTEIQKGDNPADISREEQQAIIIYATSAFLAIL